MKDFTSLQSDIAILEIIENYLEAMNLKDLAVPGFSKSELDQLTNALDGARDRRLSRIREELTYKRRSGRAATA